ncbi:unnamed protein product, partial [Ceratitis capitata]
LPFPITTVNIQTPYASVVPITILDCRIDKIAWELIVNRRTELHRIDQDLKPVI